MTSGRAFHTNTCTECRAALAHNPRRKGTMCRSCAARARVKSDAHRAMAAAAMTRRWADPDQRARLVKAARRGLHERLDHDPDFKTRRLDQCRANGLKSAHLVNTPAGSPQRRKAAQRLTENKLGWCPLEYWDEYRNLRVNGGFRAVDARRMIEDQIERDLDRYIATGRLQRSGVAA
jgi:hypothetical protein